MDAKLKEILRKLADDIEDLRASVAAIAAYSFRPTSIADAQDAKNLAKQGQKQHYDELRKEIEAL